MAKANKFHFRWMPQDRTDLSKIILKGFVTKWKTLEWFHRIISIMLEFNNFHLVFKCISLRVMNYKRWIHRPVREIIRFKAMIFISVLTLSLLSVTKGQDLSQISCQICEETIDHVGNFLGGSPGWVLKVSESLRLISYLKSKVFELGKRML